MKVSNEMKRYLIFSILVYTILIFFLTICNVRFSIYYLTATAVILFVVFMELRLSKRIREKEKELLGLDWLLSELRHRYYVHGMVDEAMKEAYDACHDFQLRKKIQGILRVLASTDPKTSASMFRQQIKDRYYGMLLTLSMMVMEFGDKQVDGQSLYLTNLKNLRVELHMEVTSSITIRHSFTGLTFVLLMPLASLKLIEAWGMNNLPELEAYYHGTYQIIFYLVLFFVTLALYYLFYLMKSPMKIIVNTHEILKWISKKSVINRFASNYEHLFPRSANGLKILMKETGEDMTLVMFLAKRVIYGAGTFIFCLILLFFLFQMKNASLLVAVSIVLGIIAAKFPVWLLKYKRKMVQMYMEDEVLSYHSILMMLMYMDRISTYELLEAMEEFAVIFKRQLKACLTEYESGQLKALLHLKREVRCESMQKLIDNLMMADEIGVEKAMDELTLELGFYNERRKQQNEYLLEKKGLICKFLAFVPLVLTIGFYLILPFVTVSITKLLEISEEISK